jgi:DNA-binding transcriptional MocR family regulator
LETWQEVCSGLAAPIGVALIAFSGLPNASYFPYDTLEAQTARPDRFIPTPNDPSGIDGKAASLTLETPDTSASSHIVVPHAAGTTNPLEAIDLTTALQYGLVDGYPPLLSFIRQFARESLHPNIPYLNGPDVILSCGNTDGYSKVIQAFSNEWNPGRDWVREREGILCEEFAYLSGIQASQPRGLQVVPVKVDGQGMLASGPGGLEDVLQNWDERKGKRPHLLYTITCVLYSITCSMLTT